MDDELVQTCLREVDNILAQHNWQLVTAREPFAAQVAAEVAALLARGGRALDVAVCVRRSVLALYGVILHAACGTVEPERNDRAFAELWAYLHPWLRRNLRDESRAADGTQSALVKIWQRRAQCREPRSFLRWAQMIALNESKSLLRVDSAEAETETELMAAELPGADLAELSGVRAEVTQSPRLADARQRARVLAAIQQCIQGSDVQQRVIIELFLNERDIEEAARLLGVGIANLSVLKTRALKTLRACAQFIDALEDWLDLSALAGTQ